MKIASLLAAVVLFSQFASAMPQRRDFQKYNAALCKAEVDYKSLAVAVANDRFKVGEYTKADVAAEKASLLQSQYECGAIDAVKYCSDKAVLLGEISAAKRAEAQVGSASGDEVRAAKIAVLDFANECEKLSKEQYCKAKIALLNADLAQAKDRFKVGEYTKSEVLKTELAIAIAQEECAY